MSSHLAVTAVGTDRPGIVNALSKTISDCGCSIEDSRMSILGDEFALILLLSGPWNAIAKVESALLKTADDLELRLFTKRTEQRQPQPDLLSYHIEALALDQPGLVHRVTDFFSTRQINIESLNTSAYNAAHTGTPMFAMSLTINVPASVAIAELRDQFLDFCDELNLDGVIEPVRT